MFFGRLLVILHSGVVAEGTLCWERKEGRPIFPVLSCTVSEHNVFLGVSLSAGICGPSSACGLSFCEWEPAGFCDFSSQGAGNFRLALGSALYRPGGEVVAPDMRVVQVAGSNPALVIIFLLQHLELLDA